MEDNMHVQLSDYSVTLEISIPFRRSLCREMKKWLLEAIAARGFPVHDPKLLNQDIIEDEAERIMDEIIDGLKVEFPHHAEVGFAGSSGEGTTDWLEEMLSMEI